ncbi:MAG: SMP-30/gluconolactonase/LRE family protein [Acidobacteriaceae bacterium]
MMQFLKINSKQDTHQHTEPKLDSIFPDAALPGGEVDAFGSGLGPQATSDGVVLIPQATIGDVHGSVVLSREHKLTLKVPEGAISGPLTIRRNGIHSNHLPLRVAVPLAENLHPVTNPVVDADGNLYTTFSGQRGQEVPVSIFRIDRDYQMRPFVRGLMNATGLAFDHDGYLYASSRAEGTVYRISPEGAMSTYAEGMGVATGIAFDGEGNLFVGDRSGTIFKIARDQQIFVCATLEPSVAAYHLAFNEEGTLFVTGPTTSSNEAVYAIDRNGDSTVFYRGLGRPQGLAFDTSGNLYVAASLHGQRGIVRITAEKEASLVLAGSDIVGLCFVEDGCAAIATRNAIYHVSLDIEGRPLI